MAATATKPSRAKRVRRSDSDSPRKIVFQVIAYACGDDRDKAKIIGEFADPVSALRRSYEVNETMESCELTDLCQTTVEVEYETGGRANN